MDESVIISPSVVTCNPDPKRPFPPSPFPQPTIPLRSALGPLPRVKRQSITLRGKGNLGAFGEKENIAGYGVHFLAGLVFDVIFALDDDFHLVIGVGVDEGGAFFEAVETAGDGFFGVDVVAVPMRGG